MLAEAQTVTVELATIASLVSVAATAGVMRGLEWARARKGDRNSGGDRPLPRPCQEHGDRLVKVEAAIETEIPILTRQVENLEHKLDQGIRGVHDRLDRIAMK